jgi:hypothetical protein
MKRIFQFEGNLAIRRSLVALSLTTLSIAAHPSRALTYAVGTCEPRYTSFSTIQAALNAAPPPTVVHVCPGTYNEQVVITQSVTLEGVDIGGSDQAIIAPPPTGLVARTPTGYYNFQIAAQVWVNNSSGPVIISNITVDGTGNGVTATHVAAVGIFFENSAGTVKDTTTRFQSGNSLGTGIWLGGGNANPTVTVENCSIHDFDGNGINTGSPTSTYQLTTIIKGNNVNAGATCAFADTDIALDIGSTNTVTDNVLSAATSTSPGPGCGSDLSVGVGIGTNAAGSVSRNTITNTSYGMTNGSEVISITDNRIFNTGTGISTKTALMTISGNNIMNASSMAIFMPCVADANVTANRFADTAIGIYGAFTGSVLAMSNTYFNAAQTVYTSPNCVDGP